MSRTREVMLAQRSLRRLSVSPGKGQAGGTAIDRSRSLENSDNGSFSAPWVTTRLIRRRSNVRFWPAPTGYKPRAAADSAARIAGRQKYGDALFFLSEDTLK